MTVVEHDNRDVAFGVATLLLRDADVPPAPYDTDTRSGPGRGADLLGADSDMRRSSVPPATSPSRTRIVVPSAA